jgi:hypothetical protein
MEAVDKGYAECAEELENALYYDDPDYLDNSNLKDKLKAHNQRLTQCPVCPDGRLERTINGHLCDRCRRTFEWSQA